MTTSVDASGSGRLSYHHQRINHTHTRAVSCPRRRCRRLRRRGLSGLCAHANAASGLSSRVHIYVLCERLCATDTMHAAAVAMHSILCVFPAHIIPTHTCVLTIFHIYVYIYVAYACTTSRVGPRAQMCNCCCLPSCANASRSLACPCVRSQVACHTIIRHEISCVCVCVCCLSERLLCTRRALIVILFMVVLTRFEIMCTN